MTKSNGQNQRRSFPQAVTKPVDNPVENLARPRAVQPINLYKAFTGSSTTREADARDIAQHIIDLLIAVIHANEVLDARIDGLEMRLELLTAAVRPQKGGSEG